MKKGSVFVNIGRGSCCDTLALMRALGCSPGKDEEKDGETRLEEGHLKGAFLDVFEEEPCPPDHPIWTVPEEKLLMYAPAPTRVCTYRL